MKLGCFQHFTYNISTLIDFDSHNRWAFLFLFYFFDDTDETWWNVIPCENPLKQIEAEQRVENFIFVAECW